MNGCKGSISTTLMRSDPERWDPLVIVTDHDTVPDEFLHWFAVLDSGSDVAVPYIYFRSHLENTYMAKLTEHKST